MDIPVYGEFLKQLKINLWLMGIPYGDSNVHSRFFILNSFIFIMLIFEGSFFVSRISSENFLELTQLAPCMCIGMLSSLKILVVKKKRIKIFELSESLGRLYENILKDARKRSLVRKDLLLVSFLMKYFFILNVVLITVYNFSTLVIMMYNYYTKHEVVFKLPYAVLLPFSTDSWLPWSAVYTHSIICGFVCVLFYTTVDGLYFVLTSHVCGNFCVLRDIIKSLDKTNMDRLPAIVKEHQYILKLGEDLEHIFTAANLFNVLVGSVEICALGFNLTMGSWEQMPGCILFLLSVLVQILMMSVFGENVISESGKIGEAAFLCKWYEMDHNSKKTILTIMIRSNKPQRLTAYKFSTISYESFTKIISTSWSYFTILKTVYTSPETSPSK